LIANKSRVKITWAARTGAWKFAIVPVTPLSLVPLSVWRQILVCTATYIAKNRQEREWSRKR